MPKQKLGEKADRTGHGALSVARVVRGLRTLGEVLFLFVRSRVRSARAGVPGRQRLDTDRMNDAWAPAGACQPARCRRGQEFG